MFSATYPPYPAYSRRSSIPELSTKKIAENNVTLIRDTAANPFVLYKALHETPESTGNDRLFDFQNNIISGNFNAADLLVHKYDGIIRSTSKARAQAPYPSTEPSINLLSVFNAAALARGQTGTKALKAILPALERRPKDIGMVLTAVQLYVSTGNTTAAIVTLEKTLLLLEESIKASRLGAPHIPYSIYHATLSLWSASVVSESTKMERALLLQTGSHVLCSLQVRVARVLANALLEIKHE